MIVTGIILLVVGVLAKIGIVWTTGFVVLTLGLIASLLGMTGHGISGRRARRRRAAPAWRRGSLQAGRGGHRHHRAVEKHHRPRPVPGAVRRGEGPVGTDHVHGERDGNQHRQGL